MICGIGTDLVKIERILEALKRDGSRFEERICTPPEIAAAPASPRRRAEYFAGRWAAKEAAVKALGCGFGSRCQTLDLEVLPEPSGAPVLHILKPGLTADNARCHLSISHDGEYAVATVVIETA